MILISMFGVAYYLNEEPTRYLREYGGLEESQSALVRLIIRQPRMRTSLPDRVCEMAVTDVS